MDRRAVVICRRDTQIDAGIRRLVDLAWRRGVRIELVDPSPERPISDHLLSHPRAVFVIVPSDADDDASRGELPRWHAACDATHRPLLEVTRDEVQDEARVFAAIAELTGASA
jgi:hypothetical protein